MKPLFGPAPRAYKVAYAFILIGFAAVVVGFMIAVAGGPWAPLALGIIVAAVAMVSAWRVGGELMARARAKEAAALAYANKFGLTFEAKREHLADEFRVLDGSKDWDIDAFAVVSGTHGGREVVSLDRRGDITDTVKRSTTSYSREISFGREGQLVNAARLAGSVPSLVLRKRDGLDEDGLQLGGDTVIVESAEFNRRWWVRSDDKRLAYAVLTPAMIARLLADDARGIDLCFEGTWVFSTQPAGTRVPNYPRHRRLVTEVADLVPAFVLDGRY